MKRCDHVNATYIARFVHNIHTAGVSVARHGTILIHTNESILLNY